ncbi:DUF6326 family protein [Aquimarina litoralis]|uniref:DUF6326 family protein n=1 Tax=Aquimarina litoralis TaxID=584605 RepID=UPI001C59E0E6|nr:DUF6326 family protein [Aquimarina litoralis]MBW1294966.1 hypothetical protein [Aquimarina litoralis]
MKTNTIDPRILLSTLWIVILFNMIVRDLHEFLREGYIEQMMSLQIPEVNMLVYGFVAQIPIMMILLSRILKDKANTWYNTIAAVITSLGFLSTLPNADMDDIFFVIIENILLLVIIRVSWKLSKQPSKRNTELSQ